MGGTGLSLDLPMKVTPAARAPQLMQWPIMVSDPANLEAASISLIPTHRVLWRDALESQASSRAAAVKFLLTSLTTTSGQLTTSVLPSALLYRTSLLGCLRKATAKIRLIWKNSMCTMVLNMTHLSSVSDLLHLSSPCKLNDLSSGLDTALQPDQSVKHVPFIEELLAVSTARDKDGNDIITAKDLSRILGKRRAVARAVNKEFSLSFFHKIFGSTKYAVVSVFSSTL
jgi:hypothetical protein